MKRNNSARNIEDTHQIDNMESVNVVGSIKKLFVLHVIDRHLTAMISDDAVENGACLARNCLFSLVLKTFKLY